MSILKSLVSFLSVSKSNDSKNINEKFLKIRNFQLLNKESRWNPNYTVFSFGSKNVIIE
ncbi:hypothetical protein RB653_006308 [Dictyostelium firmibasis]|uniref:Uncharacterized protein n=1 Tax=Dictyostelium firmibasis TaxID=79012 RepID=A0AAN7Z1X4_9MYCE